MTEGDEMTSKQSPRDPGLDLIRPPAGGVARDEVEKKRTPKGGYTRETLAGWGVPWPPPAGWVDVIVSSGSVESVDPETPKPESALVSQGGGEPLRVPLGGAHRDVVDAWASHGGKSWNAAAKKRLGLPSRGGKSLMSALTLQTSTLQQIADRPERAEFETIISRKVLGEWLTGSSSLSREAVVRLLDEQGYAPYNAATDAGYLTETFRLAKPER